MTGDERREKQREKHERKAQKFQDVAAAEFEKSDDAIRGIPMGQPILVGHHSERRHRNAIDRCHKAIRRGIEAQKIADEHERLASSRQRSISSDDDDAIEQLECKLTALKRNHEAYKLSNKERRKAGKETLPSWVLSNSNANIRRIEKRIQELKERESLQPAEDIETERYTLREDTDDNRILFEFPGKPDSETRGFLKSMGFRWSPSRVAWVRMLNSAGRFAAEQVRNKLDAS